MRPHPAFLVTVIYMRSRGSNIGSHACAVKFYPKSHLHRFPIVSFDCHFANRAHDIVLKAKTKHNKMKRKSSHHHNCFDKKAELTLKENPKWQPKWLNCRVIIWFKFQRVSKEKKYSRRHEQSWTYNFLWKMIPAQLSCKVNASWFMLK